MPQDQSAVLFDLDGTLVDHEAASAAALHVWLPSYGLSHRDIEAAIPLWSALAQEHYPAWRAGQISFSEMRRRRVRDFLPVLGRTGPADQLDGLFAEYLAHYEAAWTAYRDAAPALRRAAAAGLLTAVLTNGEQAQQTAKLAATGLLELSGPVFASSALPAAKPDPRAYGEACRRLGVTPAQVLMVGDNYELDVLAARSAGLSAVHLDRSTDHARPSSGAISTLDDLRFPANPRPGRIPPAAPGPR